MTVEMITAIGALLAGAAGIISAILLHQKTVALLEQRLGQVERKLDSHNGYAARFAESASEMAEIRQDIAVIRTTLQFMREEKREN